MSILARTRFAVHEARAAHMGSRSLRARMVSHVTSLDGVRYFGAIRSAPSNRITEPFMKVFFAM